MESPRDVYAIKKVLSRMFLELKNEMVWLCSFKEKDICQLMRMQEIQEEMSVLCKKYVKVSESTLSVWKDVASPRKPRYSW